MSDNYYIDNEFKISSGGSPDEQKLSDFIQWIDEQKVGGEFVLKIGRKRSLTLNNIFKGAMRDWSIVNAANGGGCYVGDSEIEFFFKKWIGFGRTKITLNANGKGVKKFIPFKTSNLIESEMLELLSMIKIKWMEQYTGECKYLNRRDVNDYINRIAAGNY